MIYYPLADTVLSVIKGFIIAKALHNGNSEIEWPIKKSLNHTFGMMLIVGYLLSSWLTAYYRFLGLYRLLTFFLVGDFLLSRLVIVTWDNPKFWIFMVKLLSLTAFIEHVDFFLLETRRCQ